MPRSLRRKAPLSAALLVTVALLLSACGGGGSEEATGSSGSAALPPLDPQQEVQISFESYNLASDDLGAPVIRGLVHSFEAAHPNVSVELRGADSTEIIADVRRQAATGDAPDLTQVIFNDLPFAVESLGAQSLESLVGDKELAAALGGPFPFQPRAAELGKVDGETYALPFVFSTPVIFYNPDLLEAAGLDPAAPPRTWDEVERDAAAIKQSTGKPGMGLSCLDFTIQTDWCLQGILLSAGGGVMNAAGDKLEWDSPQNAAALGQMQKLASSGDASTAGAFDQLEAFSRGDLGMMLMTSSIQNSILEGAAGKFQVEAAPMPSFGGRPTAPTNSGGGLAILATDPAKQRAAWELMQWLTSPHAQTEISEHVGYLPSRPKLVDDDRYLKGWDKEQHGLLDPNLEQLPRLHPWRGFPGPQYEQIRQDLLDAATAIIFEGKDPASTLASAQGEAEGLMPDA